MSCRSFFLLFLFGVTVFCGCGLCQAAEAKSSGNADAFGVVKRESKISLCEGDVQLLEIPFAFESYDSTPKDKVIAVEKVGQGNNCLSVKGVGKGKSTLIVTGAGISRKYVITVSNQRRNLRQLQKELENIPGIEISMNEDVISVTGKVSNPELWRKCQDILKAYAESEVHASVTFMPDRKTLESLKELFRKLGYVVSETPDCRPNQIYLELTDVALLVRGEFYAEDKREVLKKHLADLGWLAVDGQTDEKQGKGKFKCLIEITITQPQIAVDVAFVGISKKDTDQLGTVGDGTLEGQLTIGKVYDFVSGEVSKEIGTISGNLDQTIKFLADNGITRIHHAGTVTFKNNSSGYIKVGGMAYVPVSGESNGDLKEISYGFEMTIKGKQIENDKYDLSFDLSNSNSLTDKTATNTTGYIDKEEYGIKVDRICTAEKTMILGGYNGVIENLKKSGFPFLRNVPVINWFVAGDSDTKNDTKLLILVCPHPALNSEQEIEIPKISEPKGLLQDSQLSVKEIDEKEHSKFTGFWSWLNWFRW